MQRRIKSTSKKSDAKGVVSLKRIIEPYPFTSSIWFLCLSVFFIQGRVSMVAWFDGGQREGDEKKNSKRNHVQEWERVEEK